MCADAERILSELVEKGEPSEIGSAWPIFVRAVAEALKEWDFHPTISGSVYDGTKETWFRRFMFTLNAALPKEIRKHSKSRKAFAGSVTSAMRGDRKSGKTRT